MIQSTIVEFTMDLPSFPFPFMELAAGINRIVIDVDFEYYCKIIHLPATKTMQVKAQGELAAVSEWVVPVVSYTSRVPKVAPTTHL